MLSGLSNLGEATRTVGVAGADACVVGKARRGEVDKTSVGATDKYDAAGHAALPEGLVDSGAVEPAISTYHSFASRLLRDHGVRLGLEPDAVVLADGARQTLAGRVVRSTALPLADLGRSPATLIEAVLALDDGLAELDLAPERLLEHSVDLIAWLESLPSLQVIGRDMLDAARVRAALCGLVEEFREATGYRVPVSVITEARTRTGLSQQQFASVLGVSTRTLQEWEQGRREPSGAARTLLKIAMQSPQALRQSV